MIISMTGFGKAASDFEGKKITVETKSLNSKTSDIKTRIPSTYRDRELVIRSTILKKLERGKIDLIISIENVEALPSSRINQELAQNYHDQLKELEGKLGVSTDNPIESVLRMPNVIETESFEATDEEWSCIESLLHESLNNLYDFRQKEGAALEADLNNRVDTIETLLEELLKLAPERIEAKRQKLQQRFQEVQEELDALDQNRFEQELIYYLEKLDINEEKVRLRSHIEYFRKTMALNGNQGKKLGFIAQEMGREINTIGSKANHAEMQQLVVQMKDALEKIKEQVLNVL
ncbi:YicC family protein [bacterium SCSIO 12741]|nr:YicC family protein [bacterium SCSIO 12741]